MNLNPDNIKRGNYLNHNRLGVIQVVGINPHCGDFKIETTTEWVYLKNCSGIQLTEELMLNAEGFEQYVVKHNDMTFKFGEYSINLPNKLGIHGPISGNTGNWQVFMDGRALIMFVKYVHDLQNLLRSMVDKELIIKIDVTDKTT